MLLGRGGGGQHNWNVLLVRASKAAGLSPQAVRSRKRCLSSSRWSQLAVSEEVRAALDRRQPVVALESTIISHGTKTTTTTHTWAFSSTCVVVMVSVRPCVRACVQACRTLRTCRWLGTWRLSSGTTVGGWVGGSWAATD